MDLILQLQPDRHMAARREDASMLPWWTELLCRAYEPELVKTLDDIAVQDSMQ
jgi:hypothetical protein